MDSKNKQAVVIGVTLGLAFVFVAGIVVYVNRNRLKQKLKQTFTGYSWFDSALNWYRKWDNKAYVDRLHPTVRNRYAEFLAKIEKLGYLPRATSGYRSFAEQKVLYDQNHSNAKPGLSDHNYGFALDLVLFNLDGTKQIVNKSSSNAEWEKTGVPQLAKSLGLKWGGNFATYHDPVHFYVDNGKTTADLLALTNNGKVDKEGYVLS